MTDLPQVATTKTASGWLNTCSCGHETWHPRRPGADRAAREHRANHARRIKETR